MRGSNTRSNDAARKPATGVDFTEQASRVAGSDEVTAVPARSGSFSVAGVLVHAEARASDGVAARITLIPGAIVHAADGGKLAITLEAEDAAAILAQITEIQCLHGVMSAVLVSEHSAPLDTIDEELPDE